MTKQNDSSERRADEKGYNGWANYETWNLVLWAGNDEAIYQAVREARPYTKETASVMGRKLYPCGTPDMGGHKDMGKVNWQEVADSWNED